MHLCFVFATVATFYATLGEDAITYGLNETGVTHLVTSAELLETKLKVRPSPVMYVRYSWNRSIMISVDVCSSAQNSCSSPANAGT